MIIVPVEKHFKWQNAPYMLFAIVLLNIAVFFFYQLNDNEKIFDAYVTYEKEALIEDEMSLFMDYLELPENAEKQQEFDRLYYAPDDDFGMDSVFGDEEVPEAYLEMQEAYQAEIDDARKRELVTTYILQDSGFFDYASTRSDAFESAEAFADWQKRREPVNDLIAANSSVNYALIPAEKKWYTFLTHQFMHGGVMHLAGNMFFLILCGFAVEAAIGHGRFLLFYLLSGIAGGVAHMLIDPQSSIPLVGASGAISGVMAMYLGIFRLKKIEFFYWFYLIVGYIKAPAMLILVLYLGRELGSYLLNPNDNVAYMAHFGGFVVGFLLIIAVWILSPHFLDTQYIEEDNSIDVDQVKQAKVMAAMEKLQFSTALHELDDTLSTMDPRHRYYHKNRLLKAKLMLLVQHPKAEHYVVQTLAELKQAGDSLPEQLALWQQVTNPSKWPAQARLLIALKFTHLSDIAYAEQIFEHLQAEGFADMRMSTLAARIAHHYDQKNQHERSDHYLNLAQSYA